MNDHDLKPTLRPAGELELIKPLEDRVAELEAAIRRMLIAPADVVYPAPAPALAFELRWPTVDELEYFCWVCLAIVTGTMALRTAPGLLLRMAG